MAEQAPRLVRIADGLSGREISELQLILSALAALPNKVSDIPIIAPAMLLGDPVFAPFAKQMVPPKGKSMVHESQLFERAGGVFSDTPLSVSAHVKINCASKLFDFVMYDEENRPLGSMQTRLREVSPDEMAQFKGSAFPAHMDKGDMIWAWSQPFTAESVQAYLALAQDPNPIHISDDAARSAGLAGAVVPGMLFAGVAELMLLQAVSDSIVENMKLRFMAPVLIGDALRFGVLVRAKSPSGQPEVVRIFVVRSDSIIAAIADVSLQAPT